MNWIFTQSYEIIPDLIYCQVKTCRNHFNQLINLILRCQHLLPPVALGTNQAASDLNLGMFYTADNFFQQVFHHRQYTYVPSDFLGQTPALFEPNPQYQSSQYLAFSGTSPQPRSGSRKSIQFSCPSGKSGSNLVKEYSDKSISLP